MIKRFQDEQILILNEWLKQKHLPKVCRSSLPEVGFIYSDDVTLIAALFLRKCEGNIGMLDSLVTNSEATSQQRHEAILGLTDHLIQYAQTHYSYSKLLVLTKEKSIEKRALEKGFQLSENQIVLIKQDFLTKV